MNYYEKTNLNLDLIEGEKIKKLVEAFLKEKVPAYFFKIPASSSGKYHPSFDAGEEGTIRHTNIGLEVATELLRLKEFRSVVRDYAYAAIIIHDTFKNGYDNSGHTVSAHPEIAAIEFKNFAKKYIKEHSGFFCDKYSPFYEENDFGVSKIANAVKAHMGDWGETEPTTPLEKVVFLSDYIASRKFFDKYFSSTPENLEKAFRIQDRKYHINDAISHCDELYPDIKFSDEEYNLLAEKFEDKHDCNIADNDTWSYVIKEYVNYEKKD